MINFILVNWYYPLSFIERILLFPSCLTTIYIFFWLNKIATFKISLDRSNKCKFSLASNSTKIVTVNCSVYMWDFYHPQLTTQTLLLQTSLSLIIPLLSISKNIVRKLKKKIFSWNFLYRNDEILGGKNGILIMSICRTFHRLYIHVQHLVNTFRNIETNDYFLTQIVVEFKIIFKWFAIIMWTKSTNKICIFFMSRRSCLKRTSWSVNLEQTRFLWHLKRF